MRGDIVFRVYGRHEGRESDSFFGAFRSRADAEAHIASLLANEIDGRNWAEQYHNLGFMVREFALETDFEVPPLPKPRDRYFVLGTPKSNRPGTWDSSFVEVFRRITPGVNEKVCDFIRNYSLLQTFEPFRQGGREFALIARDYTRTEVLDLHSGEVIAAEPDLGGAGFCPVGFYVPDWWDMHNDSIIPGSEYWHAGRERPCGDFGFVWGCYWGDDNSWKVQYLDLSKIRDGVVQRDDRFGYVELAIGGYTSPCFDADRDALKRSEPPSFISFLGGLEGVRFAVEMDFHLGTGRPADWQRVKNSNWD